MATSSAWDATAQRPDALSAGVVAANYRCLLWRRRGDVIEALRNVAAFRR
ncbi:hypothetical protein [Nocardia fluminea]